MKKLLHEIVLETDHVKLVPLKVNHKEDLLIAAEDGNLSNLWFTSVPKLSTIDE